VNWPHSVALLAVAPCCERIARSLALAAAPGVLRCQQSFPLVSQATGFGRCGAPPPPVEAFCSNTILLCRHLTGAIESKMTWDGSGIAHQNPWSHLHTSTGMVDELTSTPPLQPCILITTAVMTEIVCPSGHPRQVNAVDSGSEFWQARARGMSPASRPFHLVSVVHAAYARQLIGTSLSIRIGIDPSARDLS
jgi:hypothetical protein